MAAKNNSVSILGILLIIALLGLNAYQWMNNSTLKKDFTEKTSEYQELEKANTQLNFEYESKLEELEGLRGNNQELNTKIDAQKLELTRQKKKITGLIWTEKELGKARQAMADLNTQADQYISEITNLKKANDELNGQNIVLTEQNSELSQEVAVNKERISNLDSARSVLVSQTEELSADNEELSTIVDMAEAIKINYIEAKGYAVNDDGSVKSKSRAKKVKMLRTCFTTETNMVVEAGDQDFYITYTSPSGQVLAVEDLGSGALDNKLTGDKAQYTTVGSVEYDNSDMKACLDWRPNFQLSKGVYQVEIFNNGFSVGKGSFKLK